jgi:hypothetical protein
LKQAFFVALKTVSYEIKSMKYLQTDTIFYMFSSPNLQNYKHVLKLNGNKYFRVYLKNRLIMFNNQQLRK